MYQINAVVTLWVEYLTVDEIQAGSIPVYGAKIIST